MSDREVMPLITYQEVREWYAKNCPNRVFPLGCTYPLDRKAQHDADLKVLEAERKKWATWLVENNVISLVPGQSQNLGLMITAEKYQNKLSELRGKKTPGTIGKIYNDYGAP